MNTKIQRHPTDKLLLAFEKGRETYVWVFSDAQKPNLLRTLMRFALDPELSLTMKDAAVLAGKVRKM
jgi:hypothetical protein